MQGSTFELVGRLVARCFGLVWMTAALLVGACGDEGAPPSSGLNLDPAAGACGLGATACLGVCVSTVSDPSNCGGCGNVCGADQLCDQGLCRLTTEGCSSGALACGQSCVDANTDARNCGACGNTCDAAFGVCQAGACACSSGLALCEANACADLQSDPNHCGECSNACFEGQTCQLGICTCTAGLLECPTACVDPATDAANCGGCGVACAPSQVCEQGSCVCPAAQTLCTDTCVDLQTDTANCGGCGTACSPTQVCELGSCVCPEAQTLCGDTCVDTMSDVANCGTCGQACLERQQCAAGTCACPEGESECGDACVDMMTDVANCGACGTACPESQVCTEGECVCPEGQSLCDDVCIDTLTDPANCGSCGNECGLGEGCSMGMCAGGAEGEDGCVGVAQNIDLTEIAIYQTVKVPIMSEGAEVNVEERVSDVVAARSTLVRAFVSPGDGWTPRTLSARLFLQNGDAAEEVVYSTSTLMVTGDSEEMDRQSTFEFFLEPEQLTAETAYALELVECETGSGDVSNSRFPLQGGVDLGVRETGTLRVHVIPIRVNNRVPDTSEDGLRPYVDGFLASYPIAAIDITVGQPVDIGDDRDWNGMLNTVATMRFQDEPGPEVYYYGMLAPADTFQDYCGFGCVAGVGLVPEGQFGAQQARASVGLAFGDEPSVLTMLHEVAHNHGRYHAPCAPGGQIEGVDPGYPYQQASIGVYGYDHRRDMLASPERNSDIMGYCENQWFSDYTYNALLDEVVSLNQQLFSVAPPDERVGAWHVLLVDPAFGARWGLSIPGPAVATGLAETADVFDTSGALIERITVYRTRVSDIDGFSIQVPEPQPGWHAVNVAGVGMIALQRP